MSADNSYQIGVNESNGDIISGLRAAEIRFPPLSLDGKSLITFRRFEVEDR